MRYLVTCHSVVIYPNHPDKTGSGRFELAEFNFEQHARDFINYCLNGYYYDVKIVEKSS